MGENVLPEVTSTSSTMLKVQATSRLAFGATTAALVTLASGGTAVLVSHGTGVLSTPTSVPGGVVVAEPVADGAVVVERAPGTFGTPPSAGTTLDPTVQALENALAQRPQPGRRTLLVPLVDVTPPVAVPAAEPAPVAVPVAEVEPELLPGHQGRLHNPTGHVPAATPQVSATVQGVTQHAGGKHARPGKARGRHAH